MIIKNLKISFDREEGDKVYLKTENGAELVLDKFLLDKLEDKNQDLFLGLDYQPMSSGEEDKKAILNEILNPPKKE